MDIGGRQAITVIWAIGSAMAAVLRVRAGRTGNCSTRGLTRTEATRLSTIAGSPDRRIAGSPDRRIAGSPDRRIAGSPDRRIAGSPDRRIAGSPDRRIAGSPDRRIAGSPDRRIAGSPDRRIAGSPDRRIAGSPDRRIAGSFHQQMNKCGRMKAVSAPAWLRWFRCESSASRPESSVSAGSRSDIDRHCRTAGPPALSSTGSLRPPRAPVRAAGASVCDLRRGPMSGAAALRTTNQTLTVKQECGER